MLNKNKEKEERKKKRLSWGTNHFMRVGKTKRDALDRQNTKHKNKIDD